MNRNTAVWIIAAAVIGACSAAWAQDTGVQNIDTVIAEASEFRAEAQYRQAVDVLKKAAVQYPGSDVIFLELGKTWAEMAGDASRKSDMITAMEGVNKGFEALDKAVALNPDNIETRIYYGIFAVNVPGFFGKTQAGVDNLEYALEKAADDAETELTVLQYLGLGYKNLGRYAEALKTLEKALSLSPSEQEAEFIRKNIREAEKLLQEKKPVQEGDGQIQGSAEELLAQAKEYFKQGNLGEAKEAAQKSINIDDTSAEAHFLLARIFEQDATEGYDERVYEDTDTRSNLAFKMTELLEKAYSLDSSSTEIAVYYATAAVMMPFFVGRMDTGISILESIQQQQGLSDSLKKHVDYVLGYAYRKKGNSMWLNVVRGFPNSEEAEDIYDEYGLRETVHSASAPGPNTVTITFHLGFRDELEPQTAVWIEDNDGGFIKTVYVSGFSAHAREKQVNLPIWSAKSKYETNGTTGASIDWGKHTFFWDVTDSNNKKVVPGTYTVIVESSWWPSMKYGRAEAHIEIGKKKASARGSFEPYIPRLAVEYK